ncbi:MAG: metal ABC transporter substrate-binding protein [Clostridiales bacterium]|jgi:zinc transport system substrate-binding protein|nr:metal ABC transporter substrate-binding protein [Clostridiales bacterium]
MKKLIALIIALFVMFTMPGCTTNAPVSNDKVSIVCTIFPQYDWVREILGGAASDFDLTLLLDSAVDLHSYQPSVQDIAKISASDLFIYVGGESDLWVEDALKEAINPDMMVINLLDALGDDAKIEEIIEGMQEEEDHDHGEHEDHDEADHDEGAHEDHDEAGHDEDEHEDHDEDEHEDGHETDEAHTHGEEIVYDEHVWLSLRNAETLCAVIADTLSAMIPENAAVYAANCAAYIERLQALDAEYAAAVAAAPEKTLLFADRFPFRYLADDYGISCFAAFPGCSAETEASFETIAFLTTKTNELDLANIMVTETGDWAIARTIIANSAAKNQNILVLNALQSVTSANVADGTSYLGVMADNLEVIANALAYAE